MSSERTRAIFGSYVLSEVDGISAVVKDRWLLIEDRKIVGIESSKPRADIVHDVPGRFILPGLLNLHNHSCAEAFSRTRSEDRSMASADDLLSVLSPLAGTGSDLLKDLTRDERLDIARLGILQLLKGGSTTVMEPFRNWFPEMFDAALEMGIRFYGAPYIFSADSSGNDIGEQSLRTWERLFVDWHRAGDGRIRVVMSPHGSDTCDTELLRVLGRRAKELETQVTIHLAQSESEMETVASRDGGATPVQLLDQIGMLGPDLLAAHCIKASDADLRLMAARGATILNCPRTYARAGVTAAFSRFRRHGVRTLVATDGYNMDILNELSSAALISKTTDRRGDVATSQELIDAVTWQAADAISRPDLGRIRLGAIADLTIVNLSGPFLSPLHDPVRAVVALASRAEIDSVIVDGEMIVDDGRYVRSSEASIVAQARAAFAKIWSHPRFDLAAAQA